MTDYWNYPGGIRELVLFEPWEWKFWECKYLNLILVQNRTVCLMHIYQIFKNWILSIQDLGKKEYRENKDTVVFVLEFRFFSYYYYFLTFETDIFPKCSRHLFFLSFIEFNPIHTGLAINFLVWHDAFNNLNPLSPSSPS